MEYAFFSDESGISSREKCYSIGAILIPSNLNEHFHDFLLGLTTKHRITTEIKWEKVARSYNVMNFAIDLLKELVAGPYVFTCIVVLKSAYRKWHQNETDAFYTTYTLLLEHCTRELGAAIVAQFDNKSDSYPKHHEVVEVIVNYKLNKSAGSVGKIVRGDSKDSIALQAADILTGAVNAGHHLLLNPDLQINQGKLFLLEKLSAVLGWDALHYDTYPNSSFNIWHFPPEEYRGYPKTREVNPDLSVPNVEYDQLAKRS